MLTQGDVIRLMRDPSVDTRLQTAERIATVFARKELSDTERAIAGDIFRIMTRDVAERVRAALSSRLKDSPDLPHDVALQLASDVDSVALPMLESSSVLTEGDLVEIVRGAGTDRRQAVARRPGVTAPVQDALIETEDAAAVATLLSNAQAAISERSLQRILDTFPADERVHRPMVHRPELPVAIAERLVTMVSEELRGYLAMHHVLSPDLASAIIQQARELATLGLATNEDATGRLVEQLHRNGRLSTSIVLRAVCSGDLAFFEYALAIRAGIAVDNARQLIHDKGALGLKALYQRAEMPVAHFALARAAVDVMRETAFDGEKNDRARFRRKVIERVLTMMEPDVGEDSIEYLLAQLGGVPSGTAPRSQAV